MECRNKNKKTNMGMTNNNGLPLGAAACPRGINSGPMSLTINYWGHPWKVHYIITGMSLWDVKYWDLSKIHEMINHGMTWYVT